MSKFEIGDKVREVKSTYSGYNENEIESVGEVVTTGKITSFVKFKYTKKMAYDNYYEYRHIMNDNLILVDASNRTPSDALIKKQIDIIILIAKIREQKGIKLKISYSPNVCFSVMQFDENQKIVFSINEYIIYPSEELKALSNVYSRLVDYFGIGSTHHYNGKRKLYAEYSLYSPACTQCKMVHTRSALVASEDAPIGCTFVALKTLHGRVVDCARLTNGEWLRV